MIRVRRILLSGTESVRKTRRICHDLVDEYSVFAGILAKRCVVVHSTLHPYIQKSVLTRHDDELQKSWFCETYRPNRGTR